jgi:selenocysteine lyase/cysteine desulfurase
VQELRAAFPVFERLAYLNAGTNGPVPRPALEAVRESLERQASEGRGDGAFFDVLVERIAELRRRVAELLGCGQEEVGITSSTTDGVNAVVAALELGAGDEVITSDEEHPGVLAPLAAARERRGIRVRVVPFADLPGEVGPATRLVACSHVSWMTGSVVDGAALAAAGAPVLLDGAQGLGAVPVDVRNLGCDFYAASGQKWLCGPNGTGYLYVRAERALELPAPWPGYGTLADPARAFELALHQDARRFDLAFLPPHHVAWAHAALDVLQSAGWKRVHAAAAGRAERLAGLLAERGLRLAPRGGSTLVSWEAGDPARTVERLRDGGFVLRGIPGTPWVRASVGAWNDEEEIERLAAQAAQ